MSVREWLGENVGTDGGVMTPAALLLADYRAWCSRAGLEPLTRREWLHELWEAGAEVEGLTRHRAVMIGGIFLRSAPPMKRERVSRGRPPGSGAGRPIGPQSGVRWRNADGDEDEAGSVREWSTDRLRLAPGSVQLAQLWDDYGTWCSEGFKLPWHKRAFVIQLRGLGVATETWRGRAWCVGVTLAPRPEAWGPTDELPDER